MKPALKAGDWVTSCFRAPWRGQIIEKSDTVDNCYYVRILIDRHGNPMRKPQIAHLNRAWLETDAEIKKRYETIH